MISDKELKKDVANVGNWMDIIDLHWERLLGEFNNDTQFWNDTFHSMNENDWYSFVNVSEAILNSDNIPESQQYRNFSYNFNKVKERVMLGKPVIKQWNRQGYNSPATALVMTVRDIINEVHGKPTKTWNEKERARILADRVVTPFESLFDITKREDNDQPQ